MLSYISAIAFFYPQISESLLIYFESYYLRVIRAQAQIFKLTRVYPLHKR